MSEASMTEAMSAISPDTVLREGYANPRPMLRAGLVFFLLGVLTLILLCMIGFAVKAGMLDWVAAAGPVLGWLGLGGAAGAGGVAAMKK